MTGTYILSSGYYDAYFSKALKVRRLIKKGYLELFNRCENLLIPTSPVLPFKLKNNSFAYHHSVRSHIYYFNILQKFFSIDCLNTFSNFGISKIIKFFSKTFF